MFFPIESVIIIQVHARTGECSQVSCNYGVAAREGDEYIIIDYSKGEMEIEMKTDMNFKCRASLKRDKSGKLFIVRFSLSFAKIIIKSTNICILFDHPKL